MRLNKNVLRQSGAATYAAGESIVAEDQFYIRVRGRVQGPFSTDQLHSMAKRGQFSRLHEVSSDGNAWSKAAGHPDLFPAPAPIRASLRTAELGASGHAASDAADLAIGGANAESIGLADPIAVAEWFYSRAGEKSGPVNLDALKMLLRSGQVRPDDLVWRPGMPEWLSVQQIAELRDVLPAVPAFAADMTKVPRAAGLPTELRTPGMAVASVVLGILAAALATTSVVLALFVSPAVSIGGCLAALFTSVLAVIFGHSALKQIRRAPDRLSGSGLAITGLAMAYLVLAAAIIILLLLVALLLLTMVGIRAATS